MKRKKLKGVVNSKQETSKQILFKTFNVFWLLALIIIILIFFKPDVGNYMTEVLQIAATQAGAVHVSYFGKAGLENYKKITATYSSDEEEKSKNISEEG